LPGTLSYDGEGRLVASGTSSYVYDGEGRRVRKTAGGVTSWFWYGADGSLVAEDTPEAQQAGRQYLHVDALGSTRLVTRSDKSVAARMDYLPFGEEVVGSSLMGNRDVVSGYSAAGSTARQRFTGKERDAETGLDYFGARYMSGAQGRFTSPDPAAVTKKTAANPQKWNRYAYVLNNPLAFVDPNGEEEVRVTVRAFIPDSSFRYPKGIGPTWKGDGRGFSTADNASHRAQAVLTIETDPSRSSSPLVGKPALSTSGSAVDMYGLGNFTARSDVSATVGSNFRDANGNSIVSFSLSASDPLVPGAPPTGGTMTVTVSPDGSSVQMNGAVAVYPAWEAYAQQPATGNQGTLLQYTPAGTSANSPGALLTGATMNVRGRTTLRPPDPPKPPCTPGQPGCQ
jgi:RHS repeat-associated protein